MAEPIEIPFGFWARIGPRNHVLDGGPDPPCEGAILGESVAHCKALGTFCRELYRNGWTDRFDIWVVDSGGPKEAQVHSYSPGGDNKLKWKNTLAPPSEYDWTVRLRWRCGLMSNYFDHLFLFLSKHVGVFFDF